MAENQYPVDEFDRLAANRTVRGAHRRRESGAKWWIALVAVLVCAPLLGWGIVHLMGGSGSSTTSTPSASVSAAPEQPQTEAPQTEAPQTEPPAETPAPPEETEPPAEPEPAQLDLPVEVLNASNISGYAAANQEILWSVGFTNVATGNYPTMEPQITQIFYPDESFAATANEIAGQLGVPQDADHVVMGGDAEGRGVIVVVLAGELG